MQTPTQVQVTQETAKALLFKHYQVEGELTALVSYQDINFKVETKKGTNYVLKIAGPTEAKANLEYQNALLMHLADFNKNFGIPECIPNKQGETLTVIQDNNGNEIYIRLLSWVSGRMWHSVNPQTETLRFSLGLAAGEITGALKTFDHPKAHYEFDWDIAQSLWTKKHLDIFSEEEQKLVLHFQKLFEMKTASYSKLRKGIVHNDLNDHNLVVSSDLKNPKLSGIIDFGDAIYTQIINDVAITCTYAIMEHPDPLEAALSVIQGYHKAFPLKDEELQHLYSCIAMRLVISVTKSALGKKSDPENTYLLVSETQAWELLKLWKKVIPDFAYYSFRGACGFDPHPQQKTFVSWAKSQEFNLQQLFPNFPNSGAYPLDLSVSSTWIGHQSNFNDLDFFQYKIDALQKDHPDKIIAGGYLEPRPLYTSTSYDKIGNYGRESRTIHLGIDYWLNAQTPVHALFDGQVVIVTNDAGYKEYGGLIVLKHQLNDLEFYTLYGHLSVASVDTLTIGDTIKKGDAIGKLGNPEENGCWAPHLHFQIMLSLLDYKLDFPGVAYANQIHVWKSICPDPNVLFKDSALQPESKPADQDLLEFRKNHLGKSLSLSYKEPLKIVRGSGAFLMDDLGRKYLDTINNVAHVGHEHPDVVRAGQQQMAVLNTNTRYLHETINQYAEGLLETLPLELSVIHFVNSGSEANELALRMAKVYTGQKDIIASEAGYHGNTNLCVDISSYKFDGKGGQGKPEHTHIFPLPDTFRGKCRDENAAKHYAREVKKCLDFIKEKGRNPAAFIIEPIISCGGQIELPQGFLKAAYKDIRNAGALCISDEVQTGCGRMGSTFWGFQLHDVIPDIITMGKPLGNGHPLGAVACTQAVAEAFANGMEYFNTFGGNPVSCAIGLEVLKTVKRENLQDNALRTGTFLKAEFLNLAKDFPIIGDVRGQGLFLGIEFTDANLNPLPEHTEYLINRMKDFGILMSSDGPDHNVLKIKPPLVFNQNNAEELLFYLRKILNEDFMLSFKRK
ncbi:aminotransferase class III-fold pyridoxal phosphate-dependent enzyme [Gaetbulibacter aestuarii]|uniref:Aminotransferase class III-fold pyridoxal phosphate-dependent enzyme n=1 Tax=Gaetbulibacter aestuarii TaxID=1502358 RepID=A0ABW7MZ82_9FLAO